MKLTLAILFCSALFCGAQAITCYDCHRCPKVTEKTVTEKCNKKAECVSFQTQEPDGSLAPHRHCATLEDGDKNGCDAIKREFSKPVPKCRACKKDLCNKEDM